MEQLVWWGYCLPKGKIAVKRTASSLVEDAMFEQQKESRTHGPWNVETKEEALAKMEEAMNEGVYFCKDNDNKLQVLITDDGTIDEIHVQSPDALGQWTVISWSDISQAIKQAHEKSYLQTQG
jgi:hypothetical protein